MPESLWELVELDHLGKERARALRIQDKQYADMLALSWNKASEGYKSANRWYVVSLGDKVFQ